MVTTGSSTGQQIATHQGSTMGLFDNLFGKKTSGPTSSTKTTPVSDEAESLRTKNFELQQQLTELQAQLAAVNVSSNNSQ